MDVFLTGGTGLIGSHVAERLRAAGHGVVALVRPSSDVRHLESLGCRLVEGDVLDDRGALARAMAGCDAVVHAAAKVFERGRRSEFLRVNVEGTRGVLTAAGEAVPRVVHVSSVAVYSGLAVPPALTEDRWAEADPRRQRAYAAAKTLSERLAWRLHEHGAVRLTTVRPAVVYGERDRAAAPVLARYASLPLVPLPGGGSTTVPLVYAGNVATGIMAALAREATVGRAYNLGEDRPVTAGRVVALVARGLGRRARTFRVPVLPLAGLARAVDVITGWTPLPRTEMGRVIRSLTRPNPYDSSRARVELGWVNLVGHEEGVRRTVDWLRESEAVR
jgi:2-alkyl-3-oxoalkanoate reductase